MQQKPSVWNASDIQQSFHQQYDVSLDFQIQKPKTNICAAKRKIQI
jgi:hypothetical protein